MSKVLHPTMEEFDALAANGVTIVDFYADWCGPCKMLAPELEKLADAYDGKVKVAKINVDHERELAASFHVSSIPALFILKDGVVVAETLGYRPYPALAQWLNDNM